MQNTERLHALDAVRAFALLLGVFLHGAMSFITSYATGLKWAATDYSQSMVLIIIVGIIHLFRMALFFFVAGYFAHLVYHRKGPAEFLRNRTMRIVVPFVVGWIVVAPTLAAIWTWGAKTPEWPPLTSLWPSFAKWQSGEISFAHLWFLYYLLLIYVLVVGARHVFADRLDRSGAIRNRLDKYVESLLERKWAPAVFSVPLAIAAMFAPHWNPGSGMPTPDKSLLPELIPLVGYGAAFLVGWIFHRNPKLLPKLVAQFKHASIMTFLSLALMTGAALLLASGWLPAIPMRFAAGFFAALVMWYINFAIIGYALKRFDAASPRIRYVADASYWIYLAHLPLVCALQVWVADWHLHWIVKYPMIIVIAFAILFASYHYLVRFTFIGAVLNGRKYRIDSAPLPSVAS